MDQTIDISIIRPPLLSTLAFVKKENYSFPDVNSNCFGVASSHIYISALIYVAEIDTSNADKVTIDRKAFD